MKKVISTNGHWNLSGSVFTGSVELENGKKIEGEHGQYDYDWDGHWSPFAE